MKKRFNVRIVLLFRSVRTLTRLDVRRVKRFDVRTVIAVIQGYTGFKLFHCLFRMNYFKLIMSDLV